jgi:hypothetical protein
MHPIISSKVLATIGRVTGNSVKSLVVHLTNASYNIRRGDVLKDS